MSIRILPGEEHLGYAPEREEWDPAFVAESRPEDEEGDE